VLEDLHPSFAAEAMADAADFLELLSAKQRVGRGAASQCASVRAELRAAVRGMPRDGKIRLVHNLKRSMASQIAELANNPGGATQILAGAPFWDPKGRALDSLCTESGLKEAILHAHPWGTAEGNAGSNWPFESRSRIEVVI